MSRLYRIHEKTHNQVQVNCLKVPVEEGGEDRDDIDAQGVLATLGVKGYLAYDHPLPQDSGYAARV